MCYHISMKFKSHTEYTQPYSVSRRVISEIIDSRIDTYITLNKPEVILYKFFGTADLTQDESEKFFVYFKHVARRICASHIERHKGDKIPDLVEFLNDKITKVLAHDVSHSVEFTSLHRVSDNSTLQTFLRSQTNLNVDKSKVEDSVVFNEAEEELFGALFQRSNNFVKPVSLEILDVEFDIRTRVSLQNYPFCSEIGHNIKEVIEMDMSDFNNYVYKFIVVELYIRDFDQAYNDKIKTPIDERLEYLNRKLNTYKGIASGEISPELIDVLYYIWSHKENERVLVDLFFMLTESFFKKLDIKYKVE